MWENVVRGVTGVTGGAHLEAFFKQPLPVDAFRIIFKNVRLMNFTLLLNRSAFTMAGPTQERNP